MTRYGVLRGMLAAAVCVTMGTVAGGLNAATRPDGPRCEPARSGVMEAGPLQPSAAAVLAELQAAEALAAGKAGPGPARAAATRPKESALGSVVLFFSDFEADNGGMNGTLDWTWGTYAWVGDTCDSSNYPPAAAYSGARMWGTRLNTCYQNLGNNSGYATCVNGNPADDSVLSFTVDLTGASDAQLSWWEWFDLFLEWDWAEVYVNGTVVFQHCGGSFVEPIAWEQQVVDLTPFVGGPVTIAFHMMASTVVNHAGWFIDDVSVTATVDDPNIFVDPLSLSRTQPIDTVADEFITVANTGDADLTWELFDGVLPGWSDDFDSYATGSQLHGQGGWKGWFNDPSAGALASGAQFRSAPNAAAILGASDLVHEYTATSGQWIFTAWQYVPSDFTGQSYFILLNSYDDSGTSLNWSAQVLFNGSTNEVTNDGGVSGGTLPLVRGQWVEIRVEIDLDGDTGAFYYNDQLLYSGTWSGQVSGGGATSIAAVDLFANGSSVVYYDDMSLVGDGAFGLCSAPGDMPWLNVVPGSGTITPGGSTVLTATFDSTGLAVGTYSGNLCITSNDPDPGPGNETDLVIIPVELEVTPPITALVTVEVGPAGGGSVSGGGTYNIGDPATVQAYPDAGWVFLHWLVNSTEITDNPYTFEVTGDTTLTAIFQRQVAEPIPAAGTIGLVLLVGLLLGVGVFFLRRKL